MGRFSDSVGSNGRKGSLYIGNVATLMGMILAGKTTSIEGLWISMIPGAVFQQGFSIFKALYSDYHEEVGSSSAKRAASVGTLGMTVGLAFMTGPIIGSTLLNSFEQANTTGIAMVLLSTWFVGQLPSPTVKTTKKGPHRPGVFAFLNVAAARTPAALLLMVVRMLMALAFHIFQTIWTTSLQERFNFGPADHGKFMSFIGLTYALSQGFLSKVLLENLGGNVSFTARVRMIQGCCFILAVGRCAAFQTSSLGVIYGIFALIVSALGLINTILTSDTTHLASSDEIGSLFGILAAVESAAGLVGPIIGGSLALYVHPIRAPLMAVLAAYSVVFFLISWRYEKLVLQASKVKL